MNKMLKMGALKKCVAKVSLQIFCHATFFVAKSHLQGADIDWIGGQSSDMNNPLNWSPNQVPTATDTAIFSSLAQNRSAEELTTTINIGTIEYTDNIPFQISINGSGANLNLTQSGIVNGGTSPQLIQIMRGGVDFINSSTTSNITIQVTSGGTLRFDDQSSADQSVITVDGANSELFFNSASLFGQPLVTLTNGAYCKTFQPTLTLSSLSIDASSIFDFAGVNTVQVGSNNGSTTVAGSLLGDGTNAFVKVGSGSVSLTGNNSLNYLGALNVDQGTLFLDGSVGGDVVVDGGLLSGNGYALGSASVNSGSIGPTTSTSSLLFVTSYSQSPGTVYQDQVDLLGHSSLILTEGVATLGGTVNVNSNKGVLIGQPYLILESVSPLVGHFNAVTTSIPFLVPTLSQSSTSVYVTLATDFAGSASTSNQRAVALQLDTLSSSTPATTALLNALIETADPAGLQAALNQLAGTQYTTFLQRAQTAGHRLIRHLFDPIRIDWLTWDCPEEGYDQGYVSWIDGEWSRSFLRGDVNGYSFNMDSYDVAAGLYKRFNRNWVFGIAGSYEHDDTYFRIGGKDRANIGQGALVAVYETRCFYLLSDLIFGYTTAKVNRNIDFTSFTSRPEATVSLYDLISYTEGGVNFEIYDLLIQPFLALEGGYYYRNGFSENNSEVGLAVRPYSHGSFDTHLGLRLAKSLSSFSMTLDAAYVHKYTNFGDCAKEHFIYFGAPFNITAVQQDRNAFEGAANLFYFPNDTITLMAQFSGEYWNRFSTYGISGGLIINW